MSRFEPSRLASDEGERQRFLTALRDTGTLRGAARRTGVSVSTVARLRSRDHGFAAACAAVVGDPTASALEAALLGRLTYGTERCRRYADGREERWRDYNDALAWIVLKRLWPAKYGDEPATRSSPATAMPPPMTREAFVAAVMARHQPQLAAPGVDPVAGDAT